MVLQIPNLKVPTAIATAVDISEVPGCNLTNSHWQSQKLLEGLVSLELTVHLSAFFSYF